jgi:iron(II)-dependent oxidoreductase
MIGPDLIPVYDADETPRAGRGALPFLRTDGARKHLDAVRQNTLAVVAEQGQDEHRDRLELIIRHELQHNETMLQAMQIAALAPGLELHLPRSGRGTFLTIDAGEHPIGAGPEDGFSYDNERPQHRRTLPRFEIATAPVTNAEWQEFIEADGYGRRELWTAAGWAWRDAESVTAPLYWTGGHHRRFAAEVDLHADEPVLHISHFEADAYARFRDARLPSEFELEAAAPQLHAVGAVWEWTASPFGGYDGFTADPYPEYSEQFFGDGYRVLRGGSFATAARVATPSFRNWDLPQRRQIFSGLRLARG